MPYSGQATEVVPDYNVIVQKLTEKYDLPCGPDLYSYFVEHQDEINMSNPDDRVHPNATGQLSINRLYSEALLPLYPNP